MDFVERKGVRWPCVSGRDAEGGELRLVMDGRELRETSGDHERFLERLVGECEGGGNPVGCGEQGWVAGVDGEMWLLGCGWRIYYCYVCEMGSNRLSITSEPGTGESSPILICFWYTFYN